MEVLNYLLGYKNIKIYQDNKMFNFSLDSVLLPNFVTINKSIKKILDIGTGNAPIPLILSTKTKAKIIGVEIQKEVFNLAVKSVLYNNLEEQIELINEDIKQLYKEWETDEFDVITCNPPFFKIKVKSHINDSSYKTMARHEKELNLNDIMYISKKILKNGGIVSIVHRPERLVEIIDIMRENNIEPKRMQLVYPKVNSEANIILIEGRKNGKPGLKIMPPLYTHEDNGDYTVQIKNFFE
jgi:tRNA1Val (adenine37-N6)-methyltransferase